MIVRFWEARVEPGRLDDAVAWVRATLLTRAILQNGYDSHELFVADEAHGDTEVGEQPARVVLLTRWTREPAALNESLPDDGSIARAHGWYFRDV